MSVMRIFITKRYYAILAIFLGLCLLAPNAYAGRIEAGTFIAHDTLAVGTREAEFVPFQQRFDVPPIVVAISDQVGGNSASIRISNVTTTGFNELILEPDNFDGRHLAQQVQYIAIEPGRHVLPDGTVIEAGFTNSSATQFGSGVAGIASFTNVNFSRPLAPNVSVISQLQTFNSETRDVANQSSRPHITALAVNPTSTGFQLALERSQASSGPIPSTETIGWIAFPAGQSGSLPAIAGADVIWSSVNSPVNIGARNGCFTNGFGQVSANAVVVAKKNSRNNPDGGWLRYCSLNAAAIGVFIEEDTDQDSERSTSAAEQESASIIAFSRPFHSVLDADLNVTKISENFSELADLGNFSLPDSVFDYVIGISNSGNSRPNFDTIIAIDALPPQVKMVVADIGAAGSGPIEFVDGSPSSALIYNFQGLGNPSDSLEFSTNGSDFSYIPVDSGDGTDPNVTHIRVTFFGAMAPAIGGTASSLQLRFKTKIR